MIKYFSKTSIGYSHISDNKVCQDFSATYHDDERTIISVCDGHGGDIYIRSNLGSLFAVNAIMDTFKNIRKADFIGRVDEDLFKKIKINLLVRWNALVNKDLTSHPINDGEISCLSNDQARYLLEHSETAYGTTVIGAMAFDNKLIVVQLGDGESLFIKGNTIKPVFEDDDDEPVANITYSICQPDASKFIKVGVFNLNEIDGIVLCTDGVVNPYGDYDNFNKNFVLDAVKYIKSNDVSSLEEKIIKLGDQDGYGDDVSVAIMLK